jgi:hypothetical protein
MTKVKTEKHSRWRGRYASGSSQECATKRVDTGRPSANVADWTAVFPISAGSYLQQPNKLVGQFHETI